MTEYDPGADWKEYQEWCDGREPVPMDGDTEFFGCFLALIVACLFVAGITSFFV